MRGVGCGRYWKGSADAAAGTRASRKGASRRGRAVMGIGMLRSRYWAVLGFQAIMAIIMIGAFITLIAATSVFQAISTFVVLTIAGTLFWFTVKALARIQMPSPGERTRGR